VSPPEDRFTRLYPALSPELPGTGLRLRSLGLCPEPGCGRRFGIVFKDGEAHSVAHFQPQCTRFLALSGEAYLIWTELVLGAEQMQPLVDSDGN